MFEPCEGGDSERLDTFSAIAEAQTILNGLLAEFPDEARDLVARIERDIGRLREKTREEAPPSAMPPRSRPPSSRTDREPLPIDDATRHRAARRHAEGVFPHRRTRQVIGTFVQIQALATRANHVLPDPGNLKAFHQIGRTSTSASPPRRRGPCGAPTTTPPIASRHAALHAGALEFGEEGVVRVTMIDMSRMTIRGCMRHGVMSHDWSTYPSATASSAAKKGTGTFSIRVILRKGPEIRRK